MGANYSTETYFTVDTDRSGYKYVARFDEEKSEKEHVAWLTEAEL